MKKKILLTTFLLIILIANISLASYSTVTMSVVKEPVCTINLGENSNFEKRLIEKDLNNKEVTIQLKVTNGEKESKPTGELVLLLDNSLSMDEPNDEGYIRGGTIYRAAKTLLTKALTGNSSLKVAVSSFATNTDIAKEGTIEDAKEIVPLTDNLDTLLAGVEEIERNGPRTDLDAGLKIAKEQFSSESNNKYLVVLTDGVPNVAVDYDKVYASDDVINKTKTQLTDLEKNGINVVTMLTGIDNEDAKPYTGHPKTNKQIIDEVFGTSENPTAGKFYYVTDAQAEKTIVTDIYNSLLPVKQTYKDITIVDYFPAEIINNFEFAYVEKANIGEVSAEVNKANNSITWTIPELASGDTAIVQYKLKLKENFDSAIVGKLLDTNVKVDVTYKDLEDKEQSKTSNITPTLKLAEPPVVLPKAGKTTFVVLLAGISIFAIFTFVKFAIINKNVK